MSLGRLQNFNPKKGGEKKMKKDKIIRKVRERNLK